MRIISLLFCICMVLSVQAQFYKTCSVNDGVITFWVPSGFDSLSKEEIKKEFPAQIGVTKEAIYMSADKMSFVLLESTGDKEKKIDESMLESVLNTSSTAIISPGKTKIKILKKEMRTIREKPFAYLKYQASMSGVRVHKNILFFVYEEKLWAYHFTYLVKEKKIHEEREEKLINSITVQ